MMMTMGLVAQCPKQNEVCHKQFEKCQVERANCEKKKMCVYSPETRAMMQVDRLLLHQTIYLLYVVQLVSFHWIIPLVHL